MVQMNIVDEINKKNQEVYGHPCKECNLFKAYCRCDSYQEWYDNFRKPTRMNYIEYRRNAARTLSSIKSMYGEIPTELETKMNALHCVIGIMTEVQELEAGIEAGDMTNVKEELGDLMWYVANYDNTLNVESEELPYIEPKKDGIFFNIKPLKDNAELLLDMWKKKVFYNTDKYDSMIANVIANMRHNAIRFANDNTLDLFKIMQTNIDKLKARYPEKFDTDKADNRDLKNERKILENGKV